MTPEGDRLNNSLRLFDKLDTPDMVQNADAAHVSGDSLTLVTQNQISDSELLVAIDRFIDDRIDKDDKEFFQRVIDIFEECVSRYENNEDDYRIFAIDFCVEFLPDLFGPNYPSFSEENWLAAGHLIEAKCDPQTEVQHDQ